MDQSILQLYPLPVAERKLEGLYLSHDLRQYYLKSGRAFVYANFVTSIDGRIAVPRSNGNGLVVPKNIANKRDWRLFQELAAQADIIISSGRYLRDWAEGRVQEIRVDFDLKMAILNNCRSERMATGALNLPPQPVIAIVSNSLQFSNSRRFDVWWA